jgi:hypothetical protein
MVRAILREIEHPGTGKTQTRRVLMKTRNGTPVEMHPSGDANRHPFNDPDQWGFPYYDRSTDSTEIMRLSDYARRRYALGDRLYVREHWRAEEDFEVVAPRDMLPDTPIAYEASPSVAHMAMGRFRQAMHMPKWASRITLLVTDVRVERLQDIGTGDAMAEGIAHEGPGYAAPGMSWVGSPELAFRCLWQAINGDGSWDANPWVAAYSFKPVLGNIDQVGEAA